MKCACCEKDFYGGGVWCKCKEFIFCDNFCYNRRPFRLAHKAICENRHRLNLEKKEQEEREAKKSRRQKAAAKQPRVKGKYAKDETKELTEEEKEANLRHQLNVNVNLKVNALKKKAEELQELKPNWRIKCSAVRTDRYAKKDPIIYETPGKDVRKTAAQQEDVVNEEQEIFHLEEKPIEPTGAEETLKVHCYICTRKIKTVKESLRCKGKLEDGVKCLQGACHKSCINLTWKSLSVDTVNEISKSYYCGTHRKKIEAIHSDDSDEEEVTGQDAIPAPNKKKSAKAQLAPVLYNPSEAVKMMIPVDERESPKTRGEVIRLIHRYIKENQLEFEEDLGKKVRPDALLMPIYGFDPFTTREIGSKKLTPHLKRTLPLVNPAPLVPPSPATPSSPQPGSSSSPQSHANGLRSSPQPGSSSSPESHANGLRSSTQLSSPGSRPSPRYHANGLRYFPQHGSRSSPQPTVHGSRSLEPSLPIARCSRPPLNPCSPPHSSMPRLEPAHTTRHSKSRQSTAVFSPSDSPPMDMEDDCWPLMTRKSVPQNNEDSGEDSDEYSNDIPDVTKGSRAPKTYIKSTNKRKPFCNAPSRYPKLPKNVAAFSDKEGNSSGPAVGSPGEASMDAGDARDAREKSIDEENPICDKCGYHFLESSGCELCNKD